MAKIIIFGGTTEGRELSEWLCKREEPHIVCVATEYGSEILKESVDENIDEKYVSVVCGRMDSVEMEMFMREHKAGVVVDATHPYAAIVSENIKNAADKTGIRYIRLERATAKENSGADVADDIKCEKHFFKSARECAEALVHTTGNILLTTGSKELAIYAANKDIRERIVARVIPSAESLQICEDAGIPGKRIIAMQGPFSTEMNLALIHEYGIKLIVTKQSGTTGGFKEKAKAAAAAGIPIYVISRPKSKEGYSLGEVCGMLEEYMHKKSISISLIGCGPGERRYLTGEAAEAIKNAEIVFGSERLLNDMKIKGEKYPYYLAEDIIPVIKEKNRDAAILFSGDSGFYSGASKLYKALKREISSSDLEADLKITAGISSISALAAAAGISWDDAYIISLHVKGGAAGMASEIFCAVKSHKKVFALLSGVGDLKELCCLICHSGIKNCRIIAGYRLSYSDEKIFEIDPYETGTEEYAEGLYSVFILNESAQAQQTLYGIKDEEFIRGSVPMTKEEIRAVCISKLALKSDSVFYDIGSGTGSIAVAAASLSCGIKVFAIERKDEAVELIKQNREKFGAYNIDIVKEEAPNGLDSLPAATHAFIGGSGGRLFEILDVLLKINPRMRIVVTAVSLETIEELLQIKKKYSVENFETLSIQAVRTRQIKEHELLNAENPVWICSFGGE